MPVYEYECLKCGDRFEEIQKFSDEPVRKHDGCGGRVKRLLSAPAFHFKGSGWYVTDYARKGGFSGDGKTDGNKDGSSEKKSESKSETSSAKGESKPAGKTKT